MILPTIVFGILLALACGAIYHFIRGGSTKKLVLFLVLSLAGFWLGDTLAWSLNLSFLQIGLLNAGMGVVFSFVVMIVGDILSHVRLTSKEENQQE